MSHIGLLIICFLFFSINTLGVEDENSSNRHDYCSGYLSEVYGTLDPIEDPFIISDIKNFFDQNFENTNHLNYNLYYDVSKNQFIENDENQDLTKYKKVNYPNFEIIILNAHINNFILNNPHGNYCPAFGQDCKSSSLDLYFKAAEDFSKSWNSYVNPYDYLNHDFRYNQCFKLLNTSITKKNFILNLNILIQILLNK